MMLRSALIKKLTPLDPGHSELRLKAAPLCLVRHQQRVAASVAAGNVTAPARTAIFRDWEQ